MNASNDEPLGFDADPHAPDFARLAKVAEEIVLMGHDAKTAAHYAVLIGDKPERDESGAVMIRDHKGHLLARLRLKSV